MDQKAQIIKNRLSLRKPQADSLEILGNLVSTLELNKEVNIVSELAKVRALYPTCTDFERNFPSVCFALATGVGKTRLMGAFITYLYVAKGIKNFFVLAPNLTVYDKLVADLSNLNNHKYVFCGIAEFTVTAPLIITGDNYEEARHGDLFSKSVCINIFNISKINSEVRSGKEPRIKRLTEYLGESYFNYLAALPDLVLLMDESHHYRADAGLKAINELKPVIGLELTATPIDTNHNKFKNVVFDYPLALALRDGFVKEPAIATRKDFNPDQYRNDPKELDLIKLEDGIRIHEDTKVALDIYSRDTGKRLVRPFVLVVTRDTDHAKEIRELIESDRFFQGRYKDKVMEIHSNQCGEEKEENINKLLALEKPTNPIEIVIHVNMLKEGWDVTNLFTIVPLRAANSQILTEQTIGRGLRLPYGIRTGVAKIDKLTIMAHDRFQTIVDAANDPNSIIRKENIIELDPSLLPESQQEVVTVVSSIESELARKRQEIAGIQNPAEKQSAEIGLEAQQVIVDIVNTMGGSVTNLNDLKNEDVRKLAVEKMVYRIESNPQQLLFKEEIVNEIKARYATVVNELIDKTIPIPRVLIQQKQEIKCGFHDFELDTEGLSYIPVSEEIIRRTLRTNENELFQSQGEGVIRDTPDNIIVNELVNYPEIDYDREADLLYKLTKQAISKLGDGRNADELRNIVLYHKREIGKYIYVQMQTHFYLDNAGFEEHEVYTFSRIEPHNFSKYTKEDIYLYTETITPTHVIPTKVFGGFRKSCHNLYKFDSKAEKDFAIILEQDNSVLKWLRPAQAQFSIYWRHNSQRYIPDFIVETQDGIFMVEIKAERDINDEEVQEKADAGKKYCETVTAYTLKHNGRPWKYILIPHTNVALNMSFNGYVI